MLEWWNEGATKSTIVDFVARVTREGGPDFVPPADALARDVRIARVRVRWWPHELWSVFARELSASRGLC
jgi:hypothetical protein